VIRARSVISTALPAILTSVNGDVGALHVLQQPQQTNNTDHDVDDDLNDLRYSGDLIDPPQHQSNDA